MILTICGKTGKIAGETYRKNAEFAPSYWARRGFERKNSTKLLVELSPE